MERREFLQRAALLGAGVALGPWSAAVAGAELDGHALMPVPAPTPALLSQIEHVVILIQENRSYDHYFGAYRNGRGFADHPRGQAGVFAQADPLRTSGSPRGVLLPWHLDTQTMNAACTDDPSHEWSTQHYSWNHGANDRWVIAHSAHQADGPTGAPEVMGYYSRSDLPLYYGLADAFTLCDHYHAPVFGPSDPNQHYAISGTIDPAGIAGGPVVTDAPNVNAIPPSTIATNAAQYSWTTMPERLQAQGVSWKCYQPPGALSSTAADTPGLLVRYQQYSDPNSELYRNAFLPRYPHDFAADVEAGTLPAVSWVAAAPNQDEHPPSPSNIGERNAGHVLQILLRNPRVWAHTVFFVTWDENGGFFDHVSPPVAPPGTPGEFVTADPLPVEAAGIAGPIGLGFRVPLLVISPFSRGGRINSDTADHTSLLRFLETRFGVEVPNLSAWRRETTSDLTSTLNLARARLDVPALPYQALSEKLVNRECDVRSAMPPRSQHLPAQSS